MTGPIEAVLFVSSTAKDTDFTAKLVDVAPDGTAFNVQEGILRARYRESFGKKVWMREGEVYEVRVSLSATSNYFAPGHRVRLQVSSSNFPRFDRNLNTGGNNYDETTWVIARNSIHHSTGRASYVMLPVIPEKPRPPLAGRGADPTQHRPSTGGGASTGSGTGSASLNGATAEVAWPWGERPAHRRRGNRARPATAARRRLSGRNRQGTGGIIRPVSAWASEPGRFPHQAYAGLHSSMPETTGLPRVTTALIG